MMMPVNSHITHPIMVVYTGQDITTIPRNVSHLVVASNVTTIEAFAFCQCHNLVSIEFHYGLEVISEFAFGYCTALETVKLPSSMRVVGRNVFTRCTRLRSVELNEGLLMLRDGVFSFCLSLKRLRIPSTVAEIERELVFSCSALETLELPPNNTIRSIEDQSLCGCTVLKSLALPNNTATTSLGGSVFVDCPELEELVMRALGMGDTGGGTSSDILVTAFQHRFHNLPIHELCYYHSYRPVYETIGKLQAQMLSSSSEDDDDSNNGCFRRRQVKFTQCPKDLFQMTPFHILALSSKPNYHLLNALQRIYPLSAQFEKDIHGMTPIEYLVAYNNSNNHNNDDSSLGVVQCLMQSTILDRLQALPFHYHHDQLHQQHNHHHHQEIMEQVEQLYQTQPQEQGSATTTLRKIYARLSRMERHNALSLLELSIWKAKVQAVNQSLNVGLPMSQSMLSLDLWRTTQAIHLSDNSTDNSSVDDENDDDDDDDDNDNDNDNETHETPSRPKRARTHSRDPILDRQACRVNCGADVIIGNVLYFLPPLFET